MVRRDRNQNPNQNRKLGGIVHTYQKYDPKEFPSPTEPAGDFISPAFEHLLAYGDLHEFTEEQLARAIRLDPSQFAGVGPSLQSLLAILRERKKKILEKYETDSVGRLASEAYVREVGKEEPPSKLRNRYERAALEQQIFELERLWYATGNERSPFAKHLMRLMQKLADKYVIDELRSKHLFSGREPLTIVEALDIKEELDKIDELISQLEEALKNAQIAIIDMDALSEYADPGDLEKLREMQEYIERYVKEMAERQGMAKEAGVFQMTPQAYRFFQGKLLEKIFDKPEESRTGRHTNATTGEGVVELTATKQYQFGDSLAHIDMTQSLVNAMIRGANQSEQLRLKSEDIEVFRTRNSPKCATMVLMDMSGSMRYDGQYIHVKKMALALEGLIRQEYPGDFLGFLEMASLAKFRAPGEIVELMPKPVTIHDPVVQVVYDMSRSDMSESFIHPHFTNIQHGLQLARLHLATQDTPNKQIILITDGLPTAHFEQQKLFLLYPPHRRTEEATMREGLLCAQEGITINIFLIPSWSQSEEDIRFAYRLAESTRGRVFFTAGKDLDRFVVWDYVSLKREIIG